MIFMIMTWLQDNTPLLITALLGPLFTWYVTKRSYQKVEVKGKEAEVIAQNLKLYQDMLDDLAERREKEVLLLENKIEKLTARVEELTSIIEQLKNGSSST